MALGLLGFGLLGLWATLALVYLGFQATWVLGFGLRGHWATWVFGFIGLFVCGPGPGQTRTDPDGPWDIMLGLRVIWASGYLGFVLLNHLPLWASGPQGFWPLGLYASQASGSLGFGYLWLKGFGSLWLKDFGLVLAPDNLGILMEAFSPKFIRTFYSQVPTQYFNFIYKAKIYSNIQDLVGSYLS